jgi:hypothetical protein
MSKISFTTDQLPSIGSTPFWRASGLFTFANGWSVSAVYGTGMYCSCREEKKPQESCDNVEIAILRPNGDLHEFASGETVRGHTTTDELAKIMVWVSERPGENSNDQRQ